MLEQKEPMLLIDLGTNGEIALGNRQKLYACATAAGPAFEGGANRFSLGVQSFDTEIRQAMGRVSDRDTLIRQLQLLQSYDQAAVIVDLIYGFPMQTMDRWLADIATAQSLKLDGADCYQLNVYRNTPLAKANESGRLPAGADVPMQSAMFAAGVKAMQKGFYRRLSISHWARTSRERNLYNLYVKGRAHCLAFGPGAGGNLDGFFYLNQSDYRAWQEEVRAGRKPIAMLFRPFPQGKLFKAIAEGMEQGWLDIPGLEAAYGIPLGEVWKPVLEQWERAGLVERDGAFIVLTLAGQFWQVNLSQLLLDYLKRSLEA